jgi:hypothetical protein
MRKPFIDRVASRITPRRRPALDFIVGWSNPQRRIRLRIIYRRSTTNSDTTNKPNQSKSSTTMSAINSTSPILEV